MCRGCACLVPSVPEQGVLRETGVRIAFTQKTFAKVRDHSDTVLESPMDRGTWWAMVHPVVEHFHQSGVLSIYTLFIIIVSNFYWNIVDLAIVDHTYIYIYLLSFRFFSHVGHYRVLSRVPCAIW